jgi:hypothetical protein
LRLGAVITSHSMSSSPFLFQHLQKTNRVC